MDNTATVSDALRTEISWQGAETYLGVARQIAATTRDMSAADRQRASELQRTQQAIQAHIAVWQNQIAVHQRAAMTAGLVTAAMVGIGRSAVMAASQVEQAGIAMGTLMGSREKGQDMLRQLREFARLTPFEFKDMPPMAQRMLAMGTPQGEVINTMRIVGDTAAALGGGAFLIDRITLALGQMRNSLKLNAQDMKQLTEAGIPAWKLLAEGIGKTAKEARELHAAGQIGGMQGYEAILGGMKGFYGGAMAAQMETLTGKVSMFKDAIFDLSVAIGSGLLPTMKDAADGMTLVATVASKLPKPLTDVIAVGGGIATLTIAIYGINRAMQAWALSTQVNTMQQALLNAQLQQQGLSIARNTGLAAFGFGGRGVRAAMAGNVNFGAGGAMGVGMGILGGAAVGTAAGWGIGGLGGGAMEWNTGQGMAAWGGSVLAGAVGGSMFGPIGTVVGALTGLGAAATRAATELGKIGVEPAEGVRRGQEKFKFVNVPGRGLVPTADFPETYREAVRAGYGKDIQSQMTAGEAVSFWFGGAQRSFERWRAGLTEVGMRHPGRVRAEQEAKAAEGAPTPPEKAAESAASLKERREGLEAYYGALTAGNQVSAQSEAVLQEIYKAYGAEAAAARAAAKAIRDAAGDKITEKDATRALALETDALTAERKRATLAARDETEAEKGRVKALNDEAEALNRIAEMLNRSSQGVAQYMTLIGRAGAPEGGPMLREAARYQYQVGQAGRAFGAAQGDYASYLGGTQNMMAAEDVWLGPGAKLGRPSWGLKPQDIMAPWQFGTSLGNEMLAFGGSPEAQSVGGMGQAARIATDALLAMANAARMVAGGGMGGGEGGWAGPVGAAAVLGSMSRVGGGRRLTFEEKATQYAWRSGKKWREAFTGEEEERLGDTVISSQPGTGRVTRRNLQRQREMTIYGPAMAQAGQQANMTAAVQVYVETPSGWIQQNAREVKKTLQKDEYFGG